MIDYFQKRRRMAAAYRSIFMDGGRLKPEAELVLTDLAEFARFFKKVPPDPLALAVVEGGRELLRHILKNLKIQDAELSRQLRRAALSDEEGRTYE